MRWVRRTSVRRDAQRIALDQLCREVIMRRDRWTCQKCGKNAVDNPDVVLQWAHFFSRRFLALRWDLNNSCALCVGCHFRWAHHQPAEFTEWMKQRLGEKEYERLRLILKTPRRPDLKAIELYLRQELDRPYVQEYSNG